MAGDFNVGHRLWYATATLSNGLGSADAVSDSNLTLLNDGSATRTGQTGQRCSAIVLTMVTSDLFYEADWSTGIDHLLSDHLPLHIVLGEADPGLADIDRTPKYQYQRANWNLFESVLNEQCLKVDPRDANIDTYLENIRNMILKAGDAASPKGRLELEECTSTPLDGGTKSVPKLPRPRGVLFGRSRQTCRRRTKRLCV